MTSDLKGFDFEANRRKPRHAAFVTPFIDLLLLALTTYLLSDAKLVYSQGMSLDLDLPQASQKLISGKNIGTVLTIKPNGQLFLEGRRLSLQSLPQTLRSLEASGSIRGPLLIRADGKVKFETFVKVCDVARSHGFRTTHVAVDDGKSP